MRIPFVYRNLYGSICYLYGSVGTNDLFYGGIGLPIRGFFNGFPFGFRTIIMNDRQHRAIVKRRLVILVSEDFDAASERNGRQIAATVKQCLVDAFYAVGNHNAFQSGAPPENTVFDACNAVGNRDRHKTAASTECRVGNGRDLIVKNDAFQIFTAIEHGFTDDGNTFGNDCGLQFFARIESAFSDFRHAVGKIDACHA